MAALNVGVIGCGSIARSAHLPILTGMPDVELVALAEPDSRRRAEAGRRAPRAALFVDYQELLRLPALDAVVICLPSALHAEAAVAAFWNGKHVYLEKPLATDLGEARAVLSAWQQAGVAGMIGFNYRFNPLYQAARRQILSGRLGELVTVRSVFATSARGLPDWKRTRASGGGVLLDLASHHIDLVRFFFGQEVRTVSAFLRSQDSEGDSAALQLRLCDGLMIQSFFSLCAVEEDRFEVYGQAGKLTVDRYLSFDVEISEPFQRGARIKRWGRALRSVLRTPYLVEKRLAPGGEPSYREALAHFAASARSGRPAHPDLWDGYRSLAVIEAAEESAAAGRPVVVPELDSKGVADEPDAASPMESHRERHQVARKPQASVPE
jgi:myo-inositol 2-dehydrogenase/D-chiro-inositol 1-dehydrogenase